MAWWLMGEQHGQQVEVNAVLVPLSLPLYRHIIAL